MGFGPTTLAGKAIVSSIKAGTTADGVKGDVLLKNVGAENFWKPNSFKCNAFNQDGVRFKAKGKRYSGEVAIVRSNGLTDYRVFLGTVKGPEFKIKVSYDAASDELTPLLGALLEDPEAEVVEVA